MRSLWKTPEFTLKVLLRRPSLIPESRRRPQRLNRKTTIVYEPLVHRLFEIHNGRRYAVLGVRERMLGQRLGQFCRTRKFTLHEAKKKRKEREKRAKEARKKMPKAQSREQQAHIEAMKRKRKKRKF